MMLSTTEHLQHMKIKKVLGIVEGNTIRARSIFHDFIAVLKNAIGGEIEEYTKLMAESREQALDRMRQRAEELGANAIIGVKFSTAFITTGAAEILAYGTAVILEESK